MAKTIVVYGGTMAGVAAAAKAAKNAPSANIHLVVPDPVNYNGSGCALGAIGTVGGQNFFDIGWKPQSNSDYYTKGSFKWWYSQVGQHYGIDAMDAELKESLAYYNNLEIHYAYDIKSIGWASPCITEVRLGRIFRDTDGIVKWDENDTLTIAGDIFIDASESGRLSRMSNFSGTVGRYDWPANTLGADERGSTGKARQQAATLMFKVTGVDTSATEPDTTTGKTKNVYRSHSNNVWSGAGGIYAYQNNSKIINFNNTHGPNGFALKPFNMAQDGPQPGIETKNTEWWVNMLLVFNVDGRAYNRDQAGDTKYLFPSDKHPDYKTVDDAWVEAREVINSADFLNAIREFPGFRAVNIVKKNGKPVVGQVLYLRETIHIAQNSKARANGTEDTNYSLHAKDFWDPSSDTRNHDDCIGLNYYGLDINAYKFEDLKQNGKYIWGNSVTKAARSDIAFPEHGSPTYIPFHAITTNYVSNLLIPGYAAGISSLGWAEARTIPNQCVLGDAAGVAAAYALNNNKAPLSLNSSDIDAIQTTLKNNGALLEK